MAEFNTLNIEGTYAGLDAATHGMRMPLKSFKKSDSKWNSIHTHYILGDSDYDLAKRLCKAGPEHCKWMRQVPVWVDITAPAYWWTEFDTYKIGTTANSTSTMHTIGRDKLDWEAFEMPEMDQDCWSEFNGYLNVISDLVQYRMNQCDGQEKAQYKEVLKAMLPMGFKYTRTACLNYAVLQNMYKQRKHHALPQWNKDFVDWIHTLPYAEFITGEWPE